MAGLTELGGMAQVAMRLLVGTRRLRLDTDELWRALYGFALASLPIVVATAAFAGMIMVLLAAVYMRKYGAYDLLGWYTGFSTFREVGPVLIGLMFSGRVGANNTSELATMAVREQLDALRVLALDPYELLVLPRTLAMVLGLGLLIVYGDVVAVLAGALAGKLLLGVDFVQFTVSLVHGVSAQDLFVGLEKAVGFGAVIAVVSTHFGLSARGGSAGVGRAVHAQVVASALGIFLIDYLLTGVLR